MSKTQTDIVNRVALDLNVMGLGQGIEAEVEADIRTRVATVLAELNARLGLYIPDLDDTPDEVFETFCDYIKKRIGDGYGRPAATEMELLAVEARIKQILRPPGSRKSLTIDPALTGYPRGRFNFNRGY